MRKFLIAFFVLALMLGGISMTAYAMDCTKDTPIDQAGEFRPRDRLPVGIIHDFGLGAFQQPRGVAGLPDGSFVVVDRIARVQHFSADGTPLAVWTMASAPFSMLGHQASMLRRARSRPAAWASR